MSKLATDYKIHIKHNISIRCTTPCHESNGAVLICFWFEVRGMWDVAVDFVMVF